MRLSRRTLLQGMGALPLTAGSFGSSAFAQAPATLPDIIEVPPVLFVHGNGDQAPLWMTTLWRMESNGVPRERMFAINLADPLARTDDSVPQQNRSSTEDQRRELGDAIKDLKRRSGQRVSPSSPIRAAAIALAATSGMEAAPMSAMPSYAVCPTTGCSVGTTTPAASSMVAVRFCAGLMKVTAK